jgi:hypothetical protein
MELTPTQMLGNVAEGQMRISRRFQRRVRLRVCRAKVSRFEFGSGRAFSPATVLFTVYTLWELVECLACSSPSLFNKLRRRDRLGGDYFARSGNQPWNHFCNPLSGIKTYWL